MVAPTRSKSSKAFWVWCLIASGLVMVTLFFSGAKFDTSKATASTPSAARASSLRNFPVVSDGTLRVFTYNVWFEEIGEQERHRALIRELEMSEADCIGLQEVTPNFRKQLEANSNLSSKYKMSSSPKTINEGYGIMLLVKRSLHPVFHELELPSRMGRNALYASIGQSRKTAVATVHLESLNSEKTRREQLTMVGDELKSFKNAVIMGDFNFDDRQTFNDWSRAHPKRSPETLENKVTLGAALPGWVDSWPLVHPGVSGATFDGHHNRPAVRNAEEVMRYDRVMVRGGKQLRPINAVLRGTESINSQGLRPSDHYGLCVDLQQQ